MRPSSSEVTRAICRVPSTPFSQAPWYTLPAHLCRFRVRSISWSYFLERLRCPEQSNKPEQLTAFVTSNRPWNINQVPIDYGSRPHLRGPAHPARINLAQEPLDLRRQSFSLCLSLLMSAFSLAIPPAMLTHHLQRLRQRSATACRIRRSDTPTASVHGLSPVTFSAQDGLSRPVSYYAFFKGWLLLSQPPGCLGLPTSFPT